MVVPLFSYGGTLGLYFSTGRPWAVQAPHPPMRAAAFVIPALFMSSTARALVCSLGQAQ